MFLFLPLLVNDCILMYLETTILYIYNFLVLYKYLFGVFFFFFSLYFGLRSLKNLGSSLILGNILMKEHPHITLHYIRNMNI